VVQGAAAPTEANYPIKPIRLIVPFAPGGTNDILARMISTHLTEILGKTVIVDNRAGAEGIIGTEIAVKATPDGYTLIVLSAAYVMNPAVRKLPYDPLKALEFIAKLGASATVLCVGPSLPVSSVKDMLAVAKSKPGQITLGSSGGFQHFATALFRILSGQDFNIVLYKGAFPAMIDVIGGQVHAILIPIVPSLPHLRSGKLKGLAMGTLRRSPLLPELPTLDSIYPGVECDQWYAMFLPAGAPRDILARLHGETVKALALPEVRDYLIKDGAEPVGSTPEELATFFQREVAKYAKIIAIGKIQAD